MYRFGWFMSVCACACAKCSCSTVCTCEEEKTTPCVLSFCAAFSPSQGKYRHQRDQSAGVYSSQGDPSSVKNVLCIIKPLHSLLNSHTTNIMYSTGHMYSIVDKCHSFIELYCYPFTPHRPVPTSCFRSVCSIATKQEHKIRTAVVFIIYICWTSQQFHVTVIL